MPPMPAVTTPIGRLWPLATDAGVFAIVRSPEAAAPPGPLDFARAADAARRLQDWFDGSTRDLDLELDLRRSAPFDRTVYEAVRSIPYGETASYAEVALMAGHPGAARAVGSALARCEVAPVVPCHRVIHADGRIGGWGSDLSSKRWLLERETAGPSRLDR
jgi:methylated-DNA-[protein]-cysteine S-methyltransferase